jgi:hypothetical protein
MKVYLDRNHCSVYQPGCESCFGGRVEVFFGERTYGLDMDVAGCVMEIAEEDDRESVTFFIKDRDGSDKELVVNKENWPDAYESWMTLYEKQHADE